MANDYSFSELLKKAVIFILSLFMIIIISKFISHSVFGIKTNEEVLSDAKRQYAKSQIVKINVDQLLIMIADSINKKCPVVIDSMITFLNAVAFQGKTFQYNYLLKIDKSKYNIEVLKASIKKQLLVGFINTPACKDFKEKKVTIIYYYKNTKDDFLFEVIFAPDLYE